MIYSHHPTRMYAKLFQTTRLRDQENSEYVRSIALSGEGPWRGKGMQLARHVGRARGLLSKIAIGWGTFKHGCCLVKLHFLCNNAKP
jgi:hypothetical protein